MTLRETWRLNLLWGAAGLIGVAAVIAVMLAARHEPAPQEPSPTPAATESADVVAGAPTGPFLPTWTVTPNVDLGWYRSFATAEMPVSAPPICRPDPALAMERTWRLNLLREGLVPETTGRLARDTLTLEAGRERLE